MVKALVQKTVRREPGSLALVVERRLEDRLTAGFARHNVNRLTEAIESERVDPDREMPGRSPYVHWAPTHIHRHSLFEPRRPFSPASGEDHCGQNK